MKLTKTQRSGLDNLKANGRLYVGKYSPELIRTFDSLVRQGLAREISNDALGKRYEAVVQ